MFASESVTTPGPNSNPVSATEAELIHVWGGHAVSVKSDHWALLDPLSQDRVLGSLDPGLISLILQDQDFWDFIDLKRLIRQTTLRDFTCFSLLPW